MVGQKTHALHEILTWLVFTENGEHRFFGQPKGQESYNIINFWILMENRILKISGSMDVKITPDFTVWPQPILIKVSGW